MTIGYGEIRARLRELGDDREPEAVSATEQLFAPLHEREPYAGVRITRDLAYGPDPRHRFDLFVGDPPTGEPEPVLVYAHAGGYVEGDKRLPGTPYYDNVGLWAVRHGMVAVTMNYRLAPAHTWPAGTDDVARLVDRLSGEIGAQRGDPSQMFLMGHSAGAAHIGSYVARYTDTPIAGAILVSGAYDFVRSDSPRIHVYIGSDRSLYAERSCVEGVAASRVPILVSCAELEPRQFQVQAEILLTAIDARRGRATPSICQPGHTHFSQVFQLNAAGAEGYFSELLLAFIASCTAPLRARSLT